MPFNSPYKTPKRYRKGPTVEEEKQMREAIVRNRQRRLEEGAKQLRSDRKSTLTLVLNISYKEFFSDNLIISKSNYKRPPNSKIQILTLKEQEKYKVKIRKRNGVSFLADASGNKIDITDGLFVISTDGTMYITYDRKDKNRDTYDDGCVCHYSFSQEKVIFAGQISVSDGDVVSLGNESGTFMPTMAHTAKIRKRLCQIACKPEESITLDFTVIDDNFQKELSRLLDDNQETIVYDFMNNALLKKDYDVCQMILDLLKKNYLKNEEK